MRELKVVGLDADGKNIICQGAIPSEQFKLPVDDRLRAALRDDSVQPEQAQLDIEVTNVLSPKEIQARIRAGASVEQVAAASGSDIARIRRFAHPVLLERSRAAELATAAHPVLADGPAVLTMQETVAAALVARGLNPDSLTWDAWRNEDSRWTVQLAWKAGRSDNLAHFRFTPGAHGGTATAIDDTAHVSCMFSRLACLLPRPSDSLDMCPAMYWLPPRPSAKPNPTPKRCHATAASRQPSARC